MTSIDELYEIKDKDGAYTIVTIIIKYLQGEMFIRASLNVLIPFINAHRIYTFQIVQDK